MNTTISKIHITGACSNMILPGVKYLLDGEVLLKNVFLWH